LHLIVQKKSPCKASCFNVKKSAAAQDFTSSTAALYSVSLALQPNRESIINTQIMFFIFKKNYWR